MTTAGEMNVTTSVLSSNINKEWEEVQVSGSVCCGQRAGPQQTIRAV